MGNFQLKKTGPTRWQVRDAASGVTISFEEGRFNDTQEVCMAAGADVTHALNSVTAIADWLSIYHYELAMGGNHTAAQLIGWQISSIRRAAGLTQMELAERCGITQPQLARIEKATYSTNIDTISKVLEELGHRLTIEPVGGNK